LTTFSTQDTRRRQTHKNTTQHRKHEQNGTHQKPGVNPSVLEVPVWLLQWEVLVHSIPKC